MLPLLRQLKSKSKSKPKSQQPTSVQNSNQSVKEVESEREFISLINAGKTVVKWSAPWCGPCKKIKVNLAFSSKLLPMQKIFVNHFIISIKNEI